jgi:hypothetical protein
MPALFALGQHPALHSVSSQLRAGEHFFAFLDDVYLVCPPDRARTLFDAIRAALLHHCGIQVHMGKTKAWNRGGAEPPGMRELGTAEDSVWVGGPDTEPQRRGLVVLGTPIGHDEFIQQHMNKVVAEHRDFLEKLQDLEDLQTAWLLLSMCANPRANYWLRSLAPLPQPTTKTSPLP